MVKLAFFMLRKGINFNKKKILLDLNLMMERGKMAFGGRISTSRSRDGVVFDSFHPHCASTDGPGEYEFSCSNTPLYRHYFNKKKNHRKCYYYTPSPSFEDADHELEAVNKVLEAMVSKKGSSVMQLRITDSPFPAQHEEDFGDQRVDEAAEEFIKRFYSQLKEQNC